MEQTPCKQLTIISGFSGTLKTTIMKSYNSDIALFSPVKRLTLLRNKYFAKHYLSPVHHFYAQYYALSQLDSSRYNNIVVERSIWDYMFFYDVFYNKYLKLDTDNLKSIDQIDYIGAFRDFIDQVPGYKINVRMLINNSDLLKSAVIEEGENNRREIYKSIDEYNKVQDKYLSFSERIISDLLGFIDSFEYFEVTDKFFKSILENDGRTI